MNQRTMKFNYILQWILLWNVLLIISDMIQEESYGWLGIVGGVVYIPMLLAQENQRWGKMFLYAALGGGVVFFSILFNKLIVGMKHLINQLYQASARRQSYVYEMFQLEATQAEQKVYSYWVLSMCIICWACISVLLLRWNNKIMGIVSGLLIAFFSAYFGLALSFDLGVVFAIVESMIFLQTTMYSNFAAMLKILICIGCLAIVSYSVVPQENKTISELDEQLRDDLAFHTVYYGEGQLKETESDKSSQQHPDEEEENGGASENVFHFKREFTIDYRIVLSVIAVFLTVAMFVVAIVSDRIRKKSMREREGMESEEIARVIHATFLYAIKWARSTNIDLLLTEDEKRYHEIYRIWLEATYSNHQMTTEQREQVRDFLIDIEQKVWKRASKKERFHIRYGLGLMMEPELYDTAII